MQILKDEIKQKIINAGKCRFKRCGYKETSMKDIAIDAGISTGNIYTYFLTKRHLLGEILNEIESEIKNLLDKIPQQYTGFNSDKLFEKLNEIIIKIATEQGEALQIMFNCNEERQFTDFKDRVLKMFTDKLQKLVASMNGDSCDNVLCEAVAKSLFEGFTHIVKKNNGCIELLQKNLNIYTEIMIKNLDKRVLEVIRVV